MNQQASKDSAGTSAITKPPYMQNRELSWLDFNKRVLDQGADPTVPLLERLNFISIFWSNLQEFFMVRVGSLTDLSLLKKSIIDPKSGMTPSQQLDAVYARCHELYPYYEKTFENLRGLLTEQNIHQLRKDDLSDDQRAFLREHMRDNVLPLLSPQIVNARHPFPHLENGGLYIIVRLDEQAVPGQGKAKKSKEEKARAKAERADEKKNLGAEGVTLGIIPLPRQAERVIELPGKGLRFMLLEHAIEMFAADIFSMYTVKHTNIICVTRNADLDATEGAEEQGEDYREHMKRILKKRSRLAPVRLESERPLSRTVKSLLLDKLELAEHQLYVTKVPLNMSYTWGLASRLSLKKRTELTQAPFVPQWPACLDKNRSIIEQVSEREVLLSYPYQSMDAFVQLLREAAVDPSVTSIKITLYRLASQSHLAEALIAAAENGKDVTALFELRARFDESNNIEWSQRFEAAGCHVIYGFRNFKVHSKICTITRRTANGVQHITQLGTGNYNEKTAKLYTDFSFITTDERIGSDAADFFRNMALENTSDDYDVLWVAPLMIKQNILRCIDEQIELARAGKPAGLFFKTNSITDREVIEKIVEASQAGVDTYLFVRGISCLLPGVPGYTEHVREVSIVGQLLEHSRIYGFGTRENCKIYLSSADLMTRNMDKRIEIAWPILDETLREQVLGYMEISWADTAKLRELLSDGSYTPLGAFAERDEDGEVELFDSQKYLIAEAQRMHLAAAELAAQHGAEGGSAMRFAFPLGQVTATTPGAVEVITEEESEFVPHVPDEKLVGKHIARAVKAAALATQDERDEEMASDEPLEVDPAIWAAVEAEVKAMHDAAAAMAAAATATAESVLQAMNQPGAASAMEAELPQGAAALSAPSSAATAAGSEAGAEARAVSDADGEEGLKAGAHAGALSGSQGEVPAGAAVKPADAADAAADAIAAEPAMAPGAKASGVAAAKPASGKDDAEALKEPASTQPASKPAAPVQPSVAASAAAATIAASASKAAAKPAAKTVAKPAAAAGATAAAPKSAASAVASAKPAVAAPTAAPAQPAAPGATGTAAVAAATPATPATGAAPAPSSTSIPVSVPISAAASKPAAPAVTSAAAVQVAPASAPASASKPAASPAPTPASASAASPAPAPAPAPTPAPAPAPAATPTAPAGSGPASTSAAEVVDPAAPVSTGRELVPAEVVEPTSKGNFLTRLLRKIFG